jgi:hypothetical protein
MKQIHGVDYYNTGDWVESNAALVENLDGAIDLRHWKIAEATPFDLNDQSPLLLTS